MTNADAGRCIYRKIEFVAFFEVMDMLCPYIFGNLVLSAFLFVYGIKSVNLVWLMIEECYASRVCL